VGNVRSAHGRIRVAAGGGVNSSEHKTQAAVHVFLCRALPPDAVHTSIDAGQGIMDPIAGAKRRDRGCRAGWPDLQIIYNGKFHCIELKTANGRLSDNQRTCANAIIAAGGAWGCCRSVEEVEALLRAWGLPLRAHTWCGAEVDARLAARELVPAKRTRARKPSPDPALLRRVEAIRARRIF